MISVILSAAKNLNPQEILRCAQNDIIVRQQKTTGV